MFARRKRPAPQIETLIAAGTRVEGHLIIRGGVHLEGYVHGNVSADADAPAAVLSIAPQGVVEGCVEVPRVIVNGEVRGDIRARDKVELGPTARVSGNVSYGIIEMAAGAVIQGRLVAPAAEGSLPALPAGEPI
jgi:cytoskeletal protein CcmA (bactofilin family)